MSSRSSIYYTFAHPHAPYHDPGLESLAYRPLQLPLQHQFQATAEQQHAQHQYQLSLAAAASGFQQQHVQQVPTFQHHHRLHHQLPVRQRPQTRQQSGAMASNYQNTTDEELAEFQKLSNEYEPEVTVRLQSRPCFGPVEVMFLLCFGGWFLNFGTDIMAELRVSADHDFRQGPLVSQRQPSTNITTEYASADPVFQAKTAVCDDFYFTLTTVLTSLPRLYRRNTPTIVP